MQLTDHDRARVADAIAAAEARTAGEIVVILANERWRYHATALALAALAALALPLIVLWLRLSPATLIAGWDFDPAAAERLTLEALLVGQALVFGAVLLLCRLTSLDRLATPHGLRRDRVHRAAQVQFRARGFENTAARTGVLLYIDTIEHIAEVVADTGIFAAVPPDHWGETIAALIAGLKLGKPGDGIVAAVTLAGAVLAARVPPVPGDVNELPNRLIEI
ncbi:hypothetical protein IP88_06990 [alpha proteobacterium AAP81b]|nr:hypothetical protein IP88_06990 [alpha proteobacterium AAP81b]